MTKKTSLFALCVFLCACAPQNHNVEQYPKKEYAEVAKMTEVGEYHSEYGLFRAALKFNSEEIDKEYDAEDYARIASLTLETMVEVGKQNDIPEYINWENMISSVDDVEIRVATRDSFYDFCPPGTIACNMLLPDEKNKIYMRSDGGYKCIVTYSAPHEYLHSLLYAIEHPDNINHEAPLVFVWNGADEPRIWREGTIEDIARLDERARCDYND